jgi:hypothetical protein
LGLIDLDGATIELSAVHFLHGRLAVIVIGEAHESEAA